MGTYREERVRCWSLISAFKQAIRLSAGGACAWLVLVEGSELDLRRVIICSKVGLSDWKQSFGQRLRLLLQQAVCRLACEIARLASKPEIAICFEKESYNCKETANRGSRIGDSWSWAGWWPLSGAVGMPKGGGEQDIYVQGGIPIKSLYKELRGIYLSTHKCGHI